MPSRLSGTLSRLSSLETHIPYLATKADIAAVQQSIAEAETRMAKHEASTMPLASGGCRRRGDQPHWELGVGDRSRTSGLAIPTTEV